MPRTGPTSGFANGWTEDPTANVKALNEASVRRLDDLRVASEKLQAAEIRRLNSEVAAVKQIAVLRDAHAKEIRQLESDRLDKIRQVDVLAGNTAADRALIAIQTLATAQAGNAETLRAAVSSTATAVAAQLEARMGAVTERIAQLEKSSYTGAGKQAYVDPQVAELMAEVKALRQQGTAVTSKSAGMSAMWAYVAGGIMLLLMVLGGFATVVTLVLKFAGKG